MNNDKLRQAIELVIKNGGSGSMLSRHMRLSYRETGELMTELEELGVLGEFNGAKPRKVLINDISDLNFNMKLNDLTNTKIEYDLQALIHTKLKECQDKDIEFQSAAITQEITNFFNHIECKFKIPKDKYKRTNVKEGKLIIKAEGK